jgi:ATP-binding cassette subfamily B protein
LKWRTTGSSVDLPLNQRLIDGLTRRFWLASVAHRLSTVKDADIIYVMQHARIVESGNANTLLKSGGVFAGLAERQLA